MNGNVERPVPSQRTERGLIAYNPRELAGYRAAMGISQDELATKMKTKRPGVARWESDRYGPLEARFGDRLLAAIEDIVASRSKLAQDGRAALAEIRASRTGK